MTFMELVKDIAAVVGCITACVGLATLIVKPLRNSMKHWVQTVVGDSDISTAVQNLETNLTNQMKELTNRVDSNCSALDNVNDQIAKLERRITKDEIHRMKEIIFSCADRCRRGAFISQHEYEYVCEVFNIYSTILLQNGGGEAEFNYIVEHYNNQCNKMQEKKGK